VRRKWGRWASKNRLFLYAILATSDDTELELILVTGGPIQRGGEGDDDDDDDAAGAGPAQTASPQERYLQKDSDDLWALGELPARGIARSTDLGVALHTYVTQQWSMLFSKPFRMV
jgi:hypothetical protein